MIPPFEFIWRCSYSVCGLPLQCLVHRPLTADLPPIPLMHSARGLRFDISNIKALHITIPSMMADKPLI
jgi:hypothetical protein